jgi:AcrR family transcriptional regulator
VATRDRILEAAVEEFLAKDESGFRVTAVAKQAGCATSVLYHHFESRSGLIDAVLVELVERLAQADEAAGDLAADAAREASDLEAFLTQLHALAERSERQRERSVDVRVRGAAQVRPRVLAALAQLQQRRRAVRATVVSILRDRALVRLDVEAVVVALALDGLDERWRSGESAPDGELAAALAP